jgi:polysaccharide biosynthesis transport protein
MTQTHAEDQLDLRQYLNVLRRRKVPIIAVTLLVVGAALVASLLQTPIYEASAEVLLQERASERIFSADQQVPQRDVSRVATAIEVMRSRSVVDAVEAALRESDPPIDVDGELRVDDLPLSIAAQGDTDVVRIAAEHEDPAQAAMIANTYARTYIAVRRELLVDDLLGAAERVQERLNVLEMQLAAVNEPVADLDRRIADAASEAERERLRAERDTVVENVAAQRQPLLAQRTSYAQQLDQLQLAGSIQTGGAQLVSQAQAPDEPVRPTPLRNAALALVLGALLGVGIAFLLEHLDDTVKDKDDLERSTEGLTALALVPTVSTWKDRSKPYVVSLREPTSPASEAYRSLRTSVQFLGLDKPLRLIQLTSANPGEGKSTTLSNLAVSLARAGQRVAVVCCDLRRPRIHEFFELDNSIGFTSVLLGQRSLSDALQPVPAEPGVTLLASGPIPPNPSELLSSSRAREVFGLLAAQFDVVLIDTPPVLPVTDGLIISSLVDATILVATAKRSTRKDTHRAMEVLRQVDAPLVGAVLNGVESEGLYGYGGYGGYSSHALKSTDVRAEAQRGSNERTTAPEAPAERAKPHPRQHT